MDASCDQNFICKIVTIWCKTCVFCCKKYPIPICILFSLFLSYLFFPWVFTFLIYSFPLIGFSIIVHRVLLGIDREKIKRVDEHDNRVLLGIDHEKIKRVEEDDNRVLLGVDREKIKRVEEDDRRKKFAKSRRSFKSIYGDRNQLIRRRHAKEKSDDDINKNLEDNDAIFSKSLKDLLSVKKPRELQELMGESIVSRGECSSSKDSQSLKTKVYDNANVKDGLEGESWGVSEYEDDEPHDKVVRWTEEDQKNVMDLGLSEAERNKRLVSLIERRRSRKNLGFQEVGSMKNKNNARISAVKIVKLNPFLEDNSCGMKSPGSAPSSLLMTTNPFDLPYEQHEEKPDLSGDNFHEEFTVGQPKEPIFSRHESFSLGAFSRPEITLDKHEIPFYKDLATKQKNIMGHGTSTVDDMGDDKHIQQDSLISDDITSGNHSHDEGESSEQLVGIMHEEDGSARKADIVFFYGGNKKVGHAASSSIVSDLQVEVSDEGSTLDDMDIEKDKESLLNSTNQSEGDVQIFKEDGNLNALSNISSDQSAISGHEIDGTSLNQEIIDKQCVSETDNNPQPLNSDMVQGDHIHESFGASQSSISHVTTQAPVISSSPKSVLQREMSTDPASPYNFANEVQQQHNHIREADSTDNGLQQTNGLGESSISNRNLENLQDENDGRL